jgi:hypothetical protein
MAEGSVFVYGRSGGSSTGSEGSGDIVNFGHVWMTVVDNRTGEQIDVDIWQEAGGEMFINAPDQKRRDAFDMVKFDVDGPTIERMLDAAARFHDTSQPYDFLHYNCTDAVEGVLWQADLDIRDYTFPMDVFDALAEMGDRGELDGFDSHLSRDLDDDNSSGPDWDDDAVDRR